MMSRLVLPAVATALAFAAAPSAQAGEALKPICADRPNKAAATCTVDAGHWQLEVDGADWTQNKQGGTTTELGIYGATVVKYGVNSKLDLELGVVPYETLRVTGSGQVSGFGDLTARAKLAVLGGDTSVTLFPFVKIPAAHTGLGNKAVEGGLIVPVGFALPGGLGLTFNPEIDAFHDSVGHGTHAAYAISGVLGRNVTPEWIAAVELWAARNEDPAARLSQASFDLGLAWIPLKDQNLQLDAGANIGLTRDTPGVNVYVGVSRRF